MTVEQLVWNIVLLSVVALLLAFYTLRHPAFTQRWLSSITKLKLFGVIDLERAVDVMSQAVAEREGQPSAGKLRRDLQRLPNAKLLWVDDHPELNDKEAEALKLAGVVVKRVKSNAEAAQEARGREYDVVISDIGRDSGAESGLDLPSSLVPDRNRVPPIVYYVRRVEALRTPDGYPVTNRPSELLDLVVDILDWRGVL
jgi:CheY-like chemotaxis protein